MSKVVPFNCDKKDLEDARAVTEVALCTIGTALQRLEHYPATAHIPELVELKRIYEELSYRLERWAK